MPTPQIVAHKSIIVTIAQRGDWLQGKGEGKIVTKARKAPAIIISILMCCAAVVAIYVVVSFVGLKIPSASATVPLLVYFAAASFALTVCVTILHLALIFIYIVLSDVREEPRSHIIDNLAYMLLGALYYLLGVFPYVWLGVALFVGITVPADILAYLSEHGVDFAAYLTICVVTVVMLSMAFNLATTTDEIERRVFKTKAIMYILVIPSAAYLTYTMPNPDVSEPLIGTIIIIGVIGVAGWFFLAAKASGKNEVLWSVIGAVSFYTIVMVCGKKLFPAIFRPFVTLDNILLLVSGGVCASIAVGMGCCGVLNRLLVTKRSDAVNSINHVIAKRGSGLEREPQKEPLEKPVWASAIGRDHHGLWTEITVGNVTQKLRWIPPGTFLMGSPQPKDQPTNDEGPQHEVTLADGFWMFDTACTQAMWWAVMGNNPSFFKGPNHPVECVSWNDIQEFLRQINKKMPGLGLSLPSEAQWEYACRAGTTTPFSFGERITREQVNYSGGSESVPVASLPANPWGLYEMHGNVWEWCADSGHENYHGAPNDGSAWLPKKFAWLYENTAAHKMAATRILRGGSWFSPSVHVTSASRDALLRNVRDSIHGFRCVRNLP